MKVSFTGRSSSKFVKFFYPFLGFFPIVLAFLYDWKIMLGWLVIALFTPQPEN